MKMMHHIDDLEKRNNVSVAALYEHYASTILMYIRQQNITKEDAEDLLVEVFLAAMESTTLFTLQEGAQLAWLQRVARNKTVDHMRRVTRQRAMDVSALTEVLPDDEYLAPEQVALRREEHARLRARIAGLPAQQQEVLRLRFANGLRSHEIGQQLNKSDSAVRMLLGRAMSFLRNVYGQQEGNIHE
jgi:RNA polymerase sigma factor (sigma-70 family)